MVNIDKLFMFLQNLGCYRIFYQIKNNCRVSTNGYKRKNVVYVCNNAYIWMTGISMLSLLSHNSGIHVYVVCPDIQQNNRLLLEETARSYGGCCTILHVPDSFAMKKTLRQRWPFFYYNQTFCGKNITRYYSSNSLPGQ